MALSGTRYREHAPRPALRPRVRAIWELAGACDDPAPQRMIPDGTMSLWFNFGAPLTSRSGDDVPTGGAVLLGELRRPFEISSRGALDLVGVSFWTGRAGAFFDAPLRELVDRQVADPPLATAHARAGVRAVAAAAPRDRIALVQDALSSALAVPRRASPPVRQALALLGRDHEPPRVASLAETVGVSPRHLERGFADEVGIAPKSLASVLRFRRALAAITTGGAELAAIALDCGYADQSHMVRDFTRFAGVPPTRFLAIEAPRQRPEWLRRPVG